MFNLQLTLDIIEAAKSDRNYDNVNAVEIANLYGRDPQDIKNEIIVKRKQLEEVKEARKSLSAFKNELDKLG